MPRKRPVESVGQMGLFSGNNARQQASLSERLLQKGLISKKSGKTNALKEVDRAFARIREFRGISVADLVESLKGKDTVSLENVLRNAVRPVRRSPAEKKAIVEAIGRIVSLANRKKKADFWRREHAKSRADYATINSQRKHLKRIAGK